MPIRATYNLQNQVEKMIEERLSPRDLWLKGCRSSGAENKLEENNEIVSDSFQDLRDETALIKAPSIYTTHCRRARSESLPQIAGISAGIPQINRVASGYVTHQENGYILEALVRFWKRGLTLFGTVEQLEPFIYSIEN